MYEPPQRSRIVRVGPATLMAMLLACFSPPVAAAAADSGPQEPPQAKPAEAPAPADPTRTGLFKYLSGMFEAGGETTSGTGDRPGRFEEFRHIPRGLYVRAFRLDFQSENSPHQAFFNGLEIGQRDQRFLAGVWGVGRYRTTFQWDQVPHSFGNQRSFFTSTSPGILDVDAGLRTQFESASDLALPNLVRAAVAGLGTVPVRGRRHDAFFRQSIRPLENWEMHLQLRRTTAAGTRPISTGTFIRRNDPAFANDSVWEGLGLEMPEPVDHRTTDITVGTQVSGQAWVMGVDYLRSAFRNDVDSLTFTNPFRVTDAAGTPSRTPAETVVLGAGFTGNRMRFTRAQLDLVPNNDYHAVSVRGTYNLPGQTQVRGLVSVARWTQNDPFLPYTLNTALVPAAVNLPAGQSPLSVNSLPAPSLDGAMRTISQDYALVNRSWDKFDFQAQYRSYDLDNQTPHLVFPGYASFGDSGWRTTADLFGVPIENLLQPFTRHNTSMGVRWKVAPALTWTEDYELEIWKRTGRDVGRTTEHRVRSRIDWRLASFAGALAGFTYADRKAPGYRSTVLEFSELRRFDESDRIRKDGRVALDLRHGPSTFSASWRTIRDDYADGFYGLQFNNRSVADAQFTFAPWERVALYGNYTQEMNHLAYRGLAIQVEGVTPVFPRENTWERSSRDAVKMFQIGIDAASAEERSVIDLAYVWSFARNRIQTANPFGAVRADSLLSATGFDYPDTTTKIQEFNISASHRLRQRLRVGFRYWYEPFTLDDFALNTLQPYVNGTITSTTPRQLFLDTRYRSYRANVGTVFVNYEF
jgi:MtrB/PioB family decaheme-associated outer membrane protein